MSGEFLETYTPVPENIHQLKADKIFGMGVDFVTNYPYSNNFEKKFELARALITDGRIFKPLTLVATEENLTGQKSLEEIGLTAVSLLENFACFPSQIPTEIRARVTEMQHELYVLLTGNGVKDIDETLAKKNRLEAVKPSSEQEQEALERLITSDPSLRDLIGIVELPILGAVANTVLFQHLSDTEKLEQMRARATKALIRPYLGEIVVHGSERLGGSFGEIVHRFPERIFGKLNPKNITQNIAMSYVENEVLKLFNKDRASGFVQLDEIILAEPNVLKRQYFQDIKTRLQTISMLPSPPAFRENIRGVYEGMEIPFPHMRQLYIVDEFCREERDGYAKKNRMYLNGGTGSGKTATTYRAMEEAGSQRGVVIGPKIAQGAWEREANKIFTDEAISTDHDVFIVKEGKDIDNPRFATARMVFISGELLGHHWGKPYFDEIMAQIIQVRGSDSLTIDEAHNFRNIEAQSTKAIVHIAREMEKYNKQQHAQDIPIMALSATPIVRQLEDMDSIMSILYPDDFGIYNNEKPRFSQYCAKDPYTCYTLLFGRKLMTKVATRDIFGEKVPEYNLEPVTLEMTPYETMVYEWVHDINHDLPDNKKLGALEFIDLLRAVVLDPEIIVNPLKKRGLNPKVNFTPNDVVSKINQYFKMWEQRTSVGAEEDFDFNWITLHGGEEGKHLLLSVLFDQENYPYGLEDFIHNSKLAYPQLRDYWNYDIPVPHTAKMAYLYELIDKAFIQTEAHSEKIVAVSPKLKDGVTDSKNHLSVRDKIELQMRHKGNAIAHIDGSISVEEREKISETWRNKGRTLSFLLATLDTIFESNDYAMRDTLENEVIDRIHILLLGWPHYQQAIDQLFGRFYRPGMSLNKDIICRALQTKGSKYGCIDEPMERAVKRTYLLTQMSLHAIELTKEDREFMENTEKGIVKISEEAMRQNNLRFLMQRLKGMGEDAALSFLKRPSGSGNKTGFDHFIDLYRDNEKDMQRIVGNNARLVVSQLERFQPEAILVVGCGSGLLPRTLAQSEGHKPARVLGVDINTQAMQLLKGMYPTIGEFAFGRASDLRQVHMVDKDLEFQKANIESESFDAVDMSFVLDWSKHSVHGEVENSERVKILAESNRVLKKNGVLIMTFPESTFKTDERFADFVSSMKHFGFEVLVDSTGNSWTNDLSRNRSLGWCITLRKIHGVQLKGMNTNHLVFDTDPQPHGSRKSPTTGPIQKPKITKPEELVLFYAKKFEIRNQLSEDINSFIDTEEIELPLPVITGSTNVNDEPVQVERGIQAVTLIRDGTEYIINAKTWQRLVESLKHRFPSDQEADERLLAAVHATARVNGNGQLDHQHYRFMLDISCSSAPNMTQEHMQGIKDLFDKSIWNRLARIVENKLDCTFSDSHYVLATLFVDCGLHDGSYEKLFEKQFQRIPEKEVTMEKKLSILLNERLQTLLAYKSTYNYDILSHIFETQL